MNVESPRRIAHPEIDWEEFRIQMPVTDKWAYFDHAAVAPLSGPARKAIENWSTEAALEGDSIWPKWKTRIEEVRRQAASLINASASELAFVPSTTAGINLVVEGFPWKEGDNVVTLANEFPANLYPWMNLAARGIETRLVDVVDGVPDLSKLSHACDSRTRIITVSWVSYCSGWRLDLDAVAEIAHRVGARFFLDAIQGLGVFPLDVKATRIDYLAADGHKWMLGPEGAGLFFSREEHLEQLRPVGIGWNSVVDRYNFSNIRLDIRPEAARYEGGSSNMVGIHGLGASLDLLNAYGVGPANSPVADRILELTDFASEVLLAAGAKLISPRVDGHKSGIVVFAMPGQEPDSIRARCQSSGVAVSCRGGGVRISLHAYNNESEIERMVELLAAEESKS